LDRKAISFPSLNMFFGGATGAPIPLPTIPMFAKKPEKAADGKEKHVPLLHIPAVRAAVTGEIVHIPDVAAPGGFDIYEHTEFDTRTGFTTRSILVLPMLNRRGFPRGAVKLINYVDPMTQAVGPFPEEVIAQAALIVKQAALALDKILVHEQMITTGIALSAERNPERLLERILLEAKFLSNADGGTLYLKTDDNKLKFAIVRNDSLNIALGGTTGKPITFPAQNASNLLVFLATLALAGGEHRKIVS